MKARRALAVAILGIYAVIHGAAVFHVEGALRYCAAFFAMACAVGVVGLLRPAFWARRYAIGIGIAGLLNCAVYFAYFQDLAGWCFGIAQLAAFATIVVALLGKRMRAHYDERAPHWKFDHWTMHVLAGALSLNVAGIGMLAYYACMDETWTTPQLRAGAFGLAVVMSVGSILSARGRILGLFVMTGAAVASVWLGWSAIEHVTSPAYRMNECGLWQEWLAWGRWETIKSIVGFAPAALGSIACFAAFLGPMIRFVRAPRR